MTNMLFLLVAGTILLGASLRLEEQTIGKGSRVYNILRNWGGVCCVIAWAGFIALSIISSL